MTKTKHETKTQNLKTLQPSMTQRDCKRMVVEVEAQVEVEVKVVLVVDGAGGEGGCGAPTLEGYYCISIAMRLRPN